VGGMGSIGSMGRHGQTRADTSEDRLTVAGAGPCSCLFTFAKAHRLASVSIGMSASRGTWVFWVSHARWPAQQVLPGV
jgi:hypothetical protein